MLDNQWFVIAVGEGQSHIKSDLLPPSGTRSVIVDIPAGSVRVLCGRTVFVEENDQTFALAVGDTRALRDLAEFRHSGPTRHATICVIDKTNGSIRVVTDRINFAKVFCRGFSSDGLVLTTHLTFMDRRQLRVSTSGLASALANGTQFNYSSLYDDCRVL